MSVEGSGDKLHLVESDYEGWVAWVGDSPIFEAVPRVPRLASAAAGAVVQEVRQPSYRVVEWKDLPAHEKIRRIELYFLRDRYPKQPVVRIDQPPNYRVRFIQYKRGAIQVAAGGVDRLEGQQRAGILAYVLGYWDERQGHSVLVEVNRNEIVKFEGGHPCWPRPHGFGLNPAFFGLTEGQVPPSPDDNRP